MAEVFRVTKEGLIEAFLRWELAYREGDPRLTVASEEETDPLVLAYDSADLMIEWLKEIATEEDSCNDQNHSHTES